jgi:hypothetical protein
MNQEPSQAVQPSTVNSNTAEDIKAVGERIMARRNVTVRIPSEGKPTVTVTYAKDALRCVVASSLLAIAASIQADYEAELQEAGEIDDPAAQREAEQREAELSEIDFLASPHTRLQHDMHVGGSYSSADARNPYMNALCDCQVPESERDTIEDEQRERWNIGVSK